jgi:tetratricopeptide (TPR) repeat protein
MGDWDGAIAEYSEALRLYPNGYAVHYSLGMAYEHKGNRQAALQEYRTAYELNPNIPTYKQAYDRLSSQ